MAQERDPGGNGDAGARALLQGICREMLPSDSALLRHLIPLSCGARADVDALSAAQLRHIAEGCEWLATFLSRAEFPAPDVDSRDYLLALGIITDECNRLRILAAETDAQLTGTGVQLQRPRTFGGLFPDP